MRTCQSARERERERERRGGERRSGAPCGISDIQVLGRTRRRRRSTYRRDLIPYTRPRRLRIAEQRDDDHKAKLLPAPFIPSRPLDQCSYHVAAFHSAWQIERVHRSGRDYGSRSFAMPLTARIAALSTRPRPPSLRFPQAECLSGQDVARSSEPTRSRIRFKDYRPFISDARIGRKHRSTSG